MSRVHRHTRSTTRVRAAAGGCGRALASPPRSGGWLLLASAALLLAACGSPLVKPGRQQVDGLWIETPVAWTDLGLRGERAWTRDGLALNALRIYTDIRPGEHVFRQKLRGSKKDEGARFRQGLSALEIVELIVEALRAGGLRQVEVDAIAPARLQGREGFRAELRFAAASGLDYRGLLLGSGNDERLSFLLYTAPAEHYFQRELDAVEAVFASVAGE